eukprot:TRINITY_DN21754_c0_g1_i1.p1 TRINITY_DN21754_c0_g1~~TRINITY_DN21754_c0_g1_i1.p1  ORF type:complete len:491 (+),score=73.35 TRINITY_DN21754_c0_g1_i1:60-1475(+)
MTTTRESTYQSITSGVGIACVLYYCFPKVRVELNILALRAKCALLWCKGGYLETQKEIQFVVGLERQRRLEECLTHVNTGGTVIDQKPLEVAKHLVLIGGGHAHAFTLKELLTNPVPGLRTTLISRSRMTPYSGMLPGYIAGVYDFDECHLDLQALCKAANIEFIQEEVTSFDPDVKTVTYGKWTIPYDVLSVDIGSAPRNTVSAETITPVKPIDSFDLRWRETLKHAISLTCDQKKPFHMAVVGGGGSGSEMVLSMEARLTREITKRNGDISLLKVVLVTRGSTVLPSHCPAAQMEMAAELKRRNIDLYLNCEVEEGGPEGLVCKNGTKIPCTETLWCTDAGTAKWLTETGVDVDDIGFVMVTDKLQSTNYPSIFAAGDCASLPTPVAKAGVFAVREGPILTQNIISYLRGEKLVDFVAPKTFLGLFGTGYHDKCIASRGVMAYSSSWLWELKDWIDRSWMNEYKVPTLC